MTLPSSERKILLDNITCSVCFEIYEDPHALKCLHTFCKKCVRNVTKISSISCPECRETTADNAVKHDFKTQCFVNMYRRIQGGAANYFKPVSPQYEQEINECMHELYKTKVQLQQNVPKFEVSLNILKKANDRQLATIDRYSNNMIEEINLNRERLKQVIKQTNSAVERSLKSSQQEYVDTIDQFDDQVKYFEGLSQNDLRNTTMTIKSLQDKISAEIEKVHNQMPKETWNISSPITIELGPTLDVRSVVQVQIRPLNETNANTNTTATARAILKNKRQSEPVQAQPVVRDVDQIASSVIKTELNYHPHRLYSIDGKLWCLTLNAIHIYDQNTCTYMNTWTNSHLRYARGLAQTSSKDIIVACSNKKGLLHLNNNCQYLNLIVQERSFSDVCYTNADNLYALDCDNGKVLIFGNLSGAWVQFHEFSTQHSNVHPKDRIAVYGDKFFLSSFNNNCVYRFSLNGEYINQFGSTGSSNRPGHFSGALLCDIDQLGNILVADYSNQRLQVYETSEGRNRADESANWIIVILPGCNLNNPVDALTDERADFTWVVTHQPNALLKITN